MSRRSRWESQLPEWACSRRGDCCRQPAYVVMTPQERTAIEQASTRPLSWSPDADPRFVRLSAGPCPLLDPSGLCSVYEVRPFNCRRYLCGREGHQPFVNTGVPVRVLLDRDFRRQYERNQRKAQRWALTMGWPQA